ncbi:SpoIIE family protein phosphatase [bacterium]|jgi:phosphoserine phosphatase RsbU/P|nr:SpoIIE family protein phosphatase [bacterium]
MKKSLAKQIYYKVLVILLALCCLICTVIGIYLDRTLSQDNIAKASMLATTIANNSAVDMVRLDIAEQQDLLNAYAKADDIEYIYILDQHKALLLHTFTPIPPAVILEQGTLFNINKEPRMIESLQVIEVNHPILQGALGWVFVGMNKRVIQKRMIEVIVQISVICLLLGLVSLLIMKRFIRSITFPLNELCHITQESRENQFKLTSDHIHKLEEFQKDGSEIGTLSKEYHNLYTELKTYIKELSEHLTERATLQKELAIAHKIQMSLLIKKPEMNHSKALTFSTFIKTAKEVGGDFYDVIEKNKVVFVMIGDVSGKGVSAALFMTAVLTSIRTAIQEMDDPSDIITSVNQHISKESSTMFVSVFLAAIEVETGVTQFVNAGHLSPILWKDRPEQLPLTGGQLMGIDPYFFYESKTVILKNNHQLILFTDGINESSNEAAEFGGQERIIGCLDTLTKDTTEKTLNTILETCDNFASETEYHDDRTIVVTQFKKTSIELPNPLSFYIENDIEELIKVQQVVQTVCDAYSLSENMAYTLNLIIEELVANTIYHGYTHHKKEHIFIEMDSQDTQMVLTIHDTGVPFNPLLYVPEETAISIQDKRAGGLGIKLIQKLCDSITYNREEDKNIVQITKEKV